MNRRSNVVCEAARHAGVWTLAAGCLCAALSAKAQTSRPALAPERLDSKAGAKLLKSHDRPEYPSVAKFNFIQGSVRLQVLVSPEGSVREAHVIAGHPILAASALRTVRRWLFRPFKTKDGPTSFSTLVDVIFSLQTKKLAPLPSHPEEYLDRQVKPPEILESPSGPSDGESVRLRVLVGDKGQAIDTKPLSGQPAHFATARKIVSCWTFRPARWGSLPIPWYLDVDVPVEGWVAARGPTDPQSGCP
ncbi:MAG TPA: energy transducer TonB [Terriglobia bacterium]|nr:energy transducer TonB [Terriglobia bacterium]